MTAFLLWYLTISLLGWVSFPLVYTLFPGLPERGYSLARAFSLLLWGYLFWLMASLGVAQNDGGGLVLALIPVLGISLWLGYRKRAEILAWMAENKSTLVVVEILFLLAFIFLAVVRAANPEALGTEKPMELAFINAILRSPTFPPRDPWLSGSSISYYYFGYVMTAMLARLTGTAGSVAFNLMAALVFALGAIGSYGVVYNLLASLLKSEKLKNGFLGLPLLGPLFLLINSNLEGFLELLHNKGLFWKIQADGSGTSVFWNWLAIKDLNLVPSQPLSWSPTRYLWWWRASRVVQDLTLSGAPQELIDEFPFFSFLLGDLHPHVLAIPFDLLAIGMALHIFLGGWKGNTRLGAYDLPIHWPGLVLPMLMIGGLAFLNTWYILVGVALICGAFLLNRLINRGWSWKRLEETIVFTGLTGLGAILLYLPFLAGFKSQAGGLLPDLVNPTRGAQLWVMFGTLLLPLFAWLISQVVIHRGAGRWKAAILTVIGFVLSLWGISWLGAMLISRLQPGLVSQVLQSQGVASIEEVFRQAAWRRLTYAGGLLTQVLLLVLPVGLLLGRLGKEKVEVQEVGIEADGQPLMLWLVIIGGLLVLGPDFLYLRDQFGWRINTIFKFYYQAWLLLSLVSAGGVAFLLTRLKGWRDVVFRLGISLVLFMGLIYPVMGLVTKTNGFKPAAGWTLDGAAYLQRDNPDEAAAINWLKQAPDGVVVEAVGGSYSAFARVSTLSGLPTVLGWPGHESQWRGGADPQGSRQDDIRTLYETPNWQTAAGILAKYQVRYIYIGSLERSSYHVNEGKFIQVLKAVFSQGNVAIYETP